VIVYKIFTKLVTKQLNLIVTGVLNLIVADIVVQLRLPNLFVKVHMLLTKPTIR
jgi:hypothetical protein